MKHLIAIALILVSATSLWAQDSQGPKIAQIKTASGNVTIMHGTSSTPAKVGNFLNQGDVIQTGADGAIGITFTDNTTMSAGPNSEIALDEYRFDSSNFNGAMLTDMRKGTLAMVSGDIARSTPGAMRVKTPTAILGVRGTRFVVQVAGDH